jgi:hypothetical protein
MISSDYFAVHFFSLLSMRSRRIGKRSWVALAAISINAYRLLGADLLNHSNQVFEKDGNTLSAVGFSSEPKLISGKIIEVPAKILKGGFEGAVSLEAQIDQNGKVEKCKINTGANKLLDSLVLAFAPQFLFSPAFEKGKSIHSAILLQIGFNRDSILENSKNAPAELEGILLDKNADKPINGAEVRLQFLDSTSDSDITIGFSRYVEMIGRIPVQRYDGGFLCAKTNGNGRFAFRLLPSGPVGLSIIMDGKIIGQLSERPRTGHGLFVNYFIEQSNRPPSFSDSFAMITVYGRQQEKSIVHLERQQVSTGLTHYLSKIILTQSTIRQIPEAASALLVRSASPFDNRYFIAGVPMLAPFHFGGSPHADIDGLMISTLNKINVRVDDNAGCAIDAGGALIEASPGFYRFADAKLRKRPEVAFDWNEIGMNAIVSIPTNKKERDYVQFGYTFGNDFGLKWLNLAYQNPNDSLGLGAPKVYRDYSLNAANTYGPLRFDSFVWLALDDYASQKIPWGTASVRVHPKNSETQSILVGGSRQYFRTGKRVGNNAFSNTVYLTNAELEGSIDSIVKSEIMNVNLDCRIERQQWHGSLTQRDPLGQNLSNYAHGEETGAHIHGYIWKDLGAFRASSNLLFSGILYGNSPDLLFDAGFSFLFDSPLFQGGLHVGRVTSRPDIRGLPDSLFRRKQLHSYIASLPLSFNSGIVAKISVQPYLRVQDNCPRMDPLKSIWDTSATTPVFAQGVDIDAQIQAFQWMALHGICNLLNTHRLTGSGDSIYEWNVPWTLRGGLHVTFFHQKAHLYLDYIASKGLPYFDFNEKRYCPIRNYSRFDISLQYRNPIVRHRYFTRYDAYFNITNTVDAINVRDYYWDSTMHRRPIFLGPILMDIGLRAGFRL